MQRYEILGKPFQIGSLTVKNRFCMAPIGGGQHHLPGGGLKDETIQYLAERAKGGFGLIFTGAFAAECEVDPYTGIGPAILQNDINRTERENQRLRSQSVCPDHHGTGAKLP